MLNTCSSCDYSQPLDGEDDGLLECRRHAIQVIGMDVDGGIVSAFPTCEPSLWCGDYKKTPKLDYRLSEFDGIWAREEAE